MFIVDLETIDVGSMIADSDENIRGKYSKEISHFSHLTLASSSSKRLFVVSDSDGYLTSISKNLKLKSRINTQERIKQILNVNNRVAVLLPDAIAFSTIVDGKLSPGYCENGMKSLTKGEEFVQMAAETFRTKQ